MSDESLTPLQQDERDAMTGDRAAILRVVSALRGYRASCAKLLAARYQDGFADGAATSSLQLAVEDIEGLS